MIADQLPHPISALRRQAGLVTPRPHPRRNPKRRLSGCSRPATRKAKSATRGMQRRSSGRSTRSTIRSWRSSSSRNSASISKTTRARPRCNASGAPSRSGVARSLRGIKRSSRTARPRPSTISSRGSSAYSGSRTGPTTAPDRCSTPENPTGHSSPSTHAEIRSAVNRSSRSMSSLRRRGPIGGVLLR